MAEEAKKAPKKRKSEGGPKAGAKAGGDRGKGGTTAVKVASGRPAVSPKEKPRMRVHYEEKVRPALVEKFKFRSVMQVPRFRKIVVSMGVGDALLDAKFLDAAVVELSQVAGQKPAVRRAKKSIANFKLREGVPIGCMVTLRGARMYEFYDRLINVAVPRIRDFRGVNPRGFDGRGNYNLGLTEHIIFPEIDYDKVGKIRGMNVTIVTTARNDEEGRELLRLMNMPFRAR